MFSPPQCGFHTQGTCLACVLVRPMRHQQQCQCRDNSPAPNTLPEASPTSAMPMPLFRVTCWVHHFRGGRKPEPESRLLNQNQSLLPTPYKVGERHRDKLASYCMVWWHGWNYKQNRFVCLNPPPDTKPKCLNPSPPHLGSLSASTAFTMTCSFPDLC